MSYSLGTRRLADATNIKAKHVHDGYNGAVEANGYGTYKVHGSRMAVDRIALPSIYQGHFLSIT